MTDKGPADWFTGDVWIDPLAQGARPSRVSVGAVHFSPGARTAWHSHEGGQILVVTEGRAWVRSRGGELAELTAGQVSVTPDGEEHWHGAAPGTFMTHISVTEGTPHWGEHVTEEEYG